MIAKDGLLSKEAIRAKYPQGSPDYPSHAKGCGCSGCYASWGEWRGAHAVVEVARVDERRRIVEAAVAAGLPETMYGLAQLIHGDTKFCPSCLDTECSGAQCAMVPDEH